MTRLPRQILIRGNACGLPGATRETGQVADGFSSGREEPSTQRVHKPFDELAEILIAADSRPLRGWPADSATALSLLKRLRNGPRHAGADLLGTLSRGRAGGPTPVVQAIARRP